MSVDRGDSEYTTAYWQFTFPDVLGPKDGLYPGDIVEARASLARIFSLVTMLFFSGMTEEELKRRLRG